MNRFLKGILLFLGLCLPVAGLAGPNTPKIQDIFPGSLTLDAECTRSARALGQIFAGMYGGNGAGVEVRVYRFEGSFDQAIEGARIPGDADVKDASTAPLGALVSMYALVTEDLDPRPMPDDWYRTVEARAADWNDQTVRTWSMTLGLAGLANFDPASPEPPTLHILSVTSPFVDLEALKTIEGTWITEMSIPLSLEGMDGGDGDFEGDWEESAPELDIALPPQARFVSFDEVSDTQMMQGDANYLVAMSIDDVSKFYRTQSERVCVEEDRQVMEFLGQALDVVYVDCLEHPGEVRPGDDVVALTLMQAPREMLSEVFGSNQGTWTLISVNEWVEEE